MIKLIAMDLDGTLLYSDKSLSETNRKTLQEAHDNGVTVVIATGRTRQGIASLLDKMPFINYAILANGAVIQNVRTNEHMSDNLLPLEKAIQLIDSCGQHDIMFDVLCDGDAFTNEEFVPDFLVRAGVPEGTFKMMLMTRHSIPDVRRYLVERGKPVEKVNLSFMNMQERANFRKVLEQDTEIAVSSSLGFNLEINAAQATKGAALMKLAQILHIDRQETMALGDGDNDLSMLLEAGIGVAMANASEAIRSQADAVTLTNDVDGVAAAVRQYVLQEGSRDS